MSIYTKTGDSGTTALATGARVYKNNPHVEAYGDVDELSAHLGLLASLDVGAARCAQIEHIQRLLMQCSATLAGSTNPDNHIADDDIQRMEQEIDAMQAKLPALRGFIIAGGGVEASQCHVARTVCRRAERRCVALNDDASGAQGNILRLLNRLSDYLFVLARVLCIEKGDGKEKFWDGKQKK